uniref:Uncharacterized protein n=1 Tax=Bombyx mori TaxID=7091 RepID=A0A8R2G9W6_BOMMO|nr:zinc finger protein 568 isoform X6 [Bombyx mori]
MENSGGNMCRCCASEGVYKDLNTTYHWMGEEEVYGDMLKDCFNVQLSVPESSDGGICEVCITQLRNAINFKKQVLLTEEQFKKHVQKVFKTSIVKVEALADDDSTDANVTDDGLSEPEFDEVPIKTEHVAETVTVGDEIKPKKRAAPIKASTSRTKKSKSSDAESPKKRKRRRDKRKNELKEERDDNVPLHRLIARERNLPEMQKQWHNLTLLLKHSNATPFKDRNDAGFVCAYCYRIFQDPDTLRGHTHADHKHQKPDYKASAGLSTFVAFLDITDLKCTICEMPFITITALMEHLFSEHDKKFYLGLTDYFQPFKLTPDQDMKCCLCDQIFHNMKLLMQHMNLHYRNFICTTCGAGFVNSFRLLRHETTHVKKKSSYACRYCGQVFASESKKKAHVNTEHKGIAGESVCRICTARFKNYYQKTRHMAQVHNVEGIKCSMCDKRFNLKSTLVLHMRSVHFKERPYECSVCNMGFFIKRHMLGHYLATHTNERKVKCEVCGKAYATENSKGKHLKKSHGLTKASLIASNVSK